MRESLTIFSGVLHQVNLTSTTPYALTLAMGGTNAFPTWFDEYRPGARSEAMMRLDQLARDAYDNQDSIKSAGGNDWNRIETHSTGAPLCIAGEQSLTEVSHGERFILVRIIRPQERNPAHRRALQHVMANQDGTLAHSFLSYVVRSVNEEGELVVEPKGPAHLSDRVRHNLGILDLGWRILNDFLALRGAAPLENPRWVRRGLHD